ncbi:hypothetical protein [Cryomorpha ignava]|uniref:hypothetical protein n=1 Tax=Cryomorpha ignava TaxID=101383 RepID=UPI001954B824|nr:hypothetical protein [Cryomorpha ignava]
MSILQILKILLKTILPPNPSAHPFPRHILHPHIRTSAHFDSAQYIASANLVHLKNLKNPVKDYFATKPIRTVVYPAMFSIRTSAHFDSAQYIASAHLVHLINLKNPV